MRLLPRVPAVAAVLFLCQLATFAYFHHVAGGWNVNSRIALVYAIVEQGTFSIDAYHDTPGMDYLNTDDKAVYGGRYYCDKSPALSFLAVPVYWLLHQAREHLGLWDDAVHELWVMRTRYVCRLFAVGLPSAVLGVLLWAFAVRFGLSQGAAFAVSTAIMLGTVLSGYATLFYPYLPGSLCTMAAWWLLLPPPHRDEWPEERGEAGGLSRGGRLFWAGLLVGLGWYLDLTSGLAGLALSALLLWRVRRCAAGVWKYFLAGLIPVAAFYAYTYSIFGELAIPYAYEYDDLFRTEMAKGFQGIHPPRLTTLYYLTVHPFKSIFFYSPILVLAPFGLGYALTHPALRRWRADALTVAFLLIAYLLYNAGYYMWWGGWAAGPRLLCPVMPFLVLPLSMWLRRGGVARAAIFGFTMALSVFWNVVIMAVNPQIPTGIPTEIMLTATIADDLPSPILNAVWPMFRHGVVALNFGRWAFGWTGLPSLAPLAALWVAAAWWLARRGASPEASE